MLFSPSFGECKNSAGQVASIQHLATYVGLNYNYSKAFISSFPYTSRRTQCIRFDIAVATLEVKYDSFDGCRHHQRVCP